MISIARLFLVICALLGSGCRSARVSPESSVTAHAEGSDSGSVAPVDPDRREIEATEGPGGVARDSATGVLLNFPVGWTVETAGDALPASARGPGAAPVRVSLRRWDADVSALESSTGASLSHLSTGPYASLESLADSPPLVLSSPHEDDDGDLRFAWFFTVGGQGLVIEALIPAVDFEQGWRQVDAIVRSASRSLGGGA